MFMVCNNILLSKWQNMTNSCKSLMMSDPQMQENERCEGKEEKEKKEKEEIVL